MPINSLKFTPAQLRKDLRRQRLKLSKRQRQQAAYQALRHLTHFKHANLKKPHAKIGVYVDAFGELPTQLLIDWLNKKGFDVYLPIVTSLQKPLSFVVLDDLNLNQARLYQHTLGMRQPATGKRIMANELDVLFMPLVALDKAGNRMGMGGGFYDRTLAKTKNKPLKIGWAYDFQLVDTLETKPWDIKLDIAVLPSQLLRFRRYLTPSTKHLATTENDADFERQTNLQEQLLDDDIVATVMNPERLRQLLDQANAFSRVNSEDLDDF